MRGFINKHINGSDLPPSLFQSNPSLVILFIEEKSDVKVGSISLIQGRPYKIGGSTLK